MSYITKFDGNVEKTVKLGGAGNQQSIEGYFLGTRDTKGEYGPGKLHVFQTQEGTIGVWGKSRMNTLLTEDHKGQMVKVTFTGMIASTKKGRNPAYGYQLQYDPSNTIDTAGVDVNTAADPSLEEDDGEELSSSGEDETSYDEVAPSRPSLPRVAASAPSADRQARVQALLKGRPNTR